MTLSAMELVGFRCQLRVPFKTARRAYREREGLQVRLAAGDGLWGIGEASPLVEFGTEDLAACRAALEAAWAELAGSTLPRSVAEVEALIARASRLESAPAARHGLELALLDLASRAAGVPLRQWLVNGRARREVPVNAVLTAREPRESGREAEQHAAAGFGVIKVKVGGCDLTEDAQRLRAVRAAVGEGVRIRLDANGSWTEQEAATALRGLSPIRLELCEQPVDAANLAGMRRLRRMVPCRIAADEAVVAPENRNDLLEGEDGPAADAVVLKPMVLGGLLTALRLAEQAKAVGVAAYVTTSLDGIVARAGAAHLAAALPEGDLACGLATGALFVEERGPDPYAPAGGKIVLPEAPGLGLDALVGSR